MNPLLFLLSACAALVVLASPHHIARHNAIAARMALAIPDDAPPLQRRARRRCRQRSSSSDGLSQTPSLNPPSTQNSSLSPTPILFNNPTPTTPTTTPTPGVDTPAAGPAPTVIPSNNYLSPYQNGMKTGEGTYYATGLGACGIVNNDGDYIVAVSHIVFDSFPNGGNPNNSPLCRKMITVTFSGKTIRVMATDRCEACQPGDLDFSPTAFQQLASMERGRIPGIQWSFDN